MNARGGTILRKLLGHADSANSAGFSLNVKSIVTAGYDKTVRVWDAETGQVIAKLEGYSDSASSAAFSNDGRKIVGTSLDRTALIFRLVRLKRLSALLATK